MATGVIIVQQCVERRLAHDHTIPLLSFPRLRGWGGDETVKLRASVCTAGGLSTRRSLTLPSFLHVYLHLVVE